MIRFGKVFAITVGLLLALCIAPIASAQGTRACGYVNIQAPGAYQRSGTTYLVGTIAATGNPITPLVSIFSDSTCATAITQSTGVTVPNAGLGSVIFYVPVGQYQVQWKNAAGGLGAFSQTISVGDSTLSVLGTYQGTTSVGITDTAFHALVAAASDIPIPAGATAIAGKRIHIRGDGIYTTGAASVLNAEAMICTVSGCATGTVVAPAGCTVVTTNQANVLSNGQFTIDCTLTSSATVGASGTYMAKSVVCANLGATTAVVLSCFADTATAVSAAVDETVREFVNIGFKFTTSNASNAAVLHSLSVELMN